MIYTLSPIDTILAMLLLKEVSWDKEGGPYGNNKNTAC